MDYVQDHFIDTAQLVTMNLFISKNQNHTLGLIMNNVGNDSLIRGQIAEGIHKGLFELGLHGLGSRRLYKIKRRATKRFSKES